MTKSQGASTQRSAPLAQRHKGLSERFTAEYLRERLSYDPETGQLTWKASRRKGMSGKPAGCAKLAGRVFVQIDRRSIAAAVIAWVIMTGTWPDEYIDHADGDPTNDRWSNLRLATPVENQRNRATPKTNTSGFKGVSYMASRRKWRASISVNGEDHYLGLFKTPEEAHRAYVDAASRYFGQFAREA